MSPVNHWSYTNKYPFTLTFTLSQSGVFKVEISEILFKYNPHEAPSKDSNPDPIGGGAHMMTSTPLICLYLH